MSTAENVSRLKSMLLTPGAGERCGLPLADELISEMLDRYPCFELAAYHLCIRLAQEDELRLADGTQTSSNRGYWLRLARDFRPDRGGTVPRADEVS